MNIIRGIVGILGTGIIAWLLSTDRKRTRFKNIIILLIIMFVLAFVGLQTTVGIAVLDSVSNFFNWLMKQAAGGTDFIFGKNTGEKGIFFFSVLMPIVFISALIGILQHIKVLPVVAKAIGWVVNKITGMGEIESYIAVMTAIIGQPNAFITVQKQLDKLSEKQIVLMSISGLSCVSATTLASYMQIVDGKFVVVAVLLNIFAAFIISCLINPYEPSDYPVNLVVEDDEAEKENFFSVLSDYIGNGFNLVLAIAATLIGFIAIITLLNNGFDAIFGITFTKMLGYVFSPLAFLIGIPKEDIVNAGSVMATKLIGNEFVALGELTNVKEHLTPKTMAMLATYVISFSNFGTLGMIIGGLKGMSMKQSRVVAANTWRIVVASVLVSMLTASVVGFFY